MLCENKQTKKDNQPIKKRLLVTIILEVLIAEQGNAVPMADRVLRGINLLAFLSWWNLASLKMCLQEKQNYVQLLHGQECFESCVPAAETGRRWESQLQQMTFF